MVLRLADLRASENEGGEPRAEEELEVDYVFVATGYQRNAHEDMLGEVRDLVQSREGKFEVERNYSVKFDGERVEKGRAGIWLQGCNEGTHGVSFAPPPPSFSSSPLLLLL